MRLMYNPSSDVLSIRLRSGRIARSEEADDGLALLYDEQGRVIGISLEDARRRLTPEELAVVTYENLATKLRESIRLP